MNRRVDEIKRWHCVHACDHDAPDAPKAWRYAVVWRDAAFTLTVSSTGGQFALHRAFKLPEDSSDGMIGILHGDRQFLRCDLLKGERCVVDVDVPLELTLLPGRSRPWGGMRTEPDPALLWWAANADGGSRQQNEKFWKALETAGKVWIREARARRYPRIKCPRCAGEGFVREKRT